MIIGLFGKTIPNEMFSYLQTLIDKIFHNGIDLKVFEPYYQKIKDRVTFPEEVGYFYDHHDVDRMDYLISVGGDGTLLDTVPLVHNSSTPVLGVNIGRMGFLSSVPKDEINAAIDALTRNDITVESRTLLRLETETRLFDEFNYALNEVTVYKKDPHSMLTISAYIDDVFINSYWADGLIIATPTGSTAYSLSCGGPIIQPGSDNFIITPIASHNLTVRPIVIPDKSRIKLKVEGRQKEIFVSLDSRFKVIDSDMELIVLKHNFKINLVQLKEGNFYRTIRDKLNWGKDIRN